MMKKGFTLMEINLAILVMAGGLLSIISLYSLGFRENRQSIEDVQSAAYADAVMSRLAAAATATNVTWEGFCRLKNYPGGATPSDAFPGWGVYAAASGGYDSMARTAFADAMTVLSRAAKGDGAKTQYPADAGRGMCAGLLVYRDREDSPILKIAFRASRNEAMFYASPLYYTEVRFQGIPTKRN